MPRQGAATGRYRMSEQGQPTQRGNHGMYILRENAGCQVYRPTWNRTRTVFRPFPAKDPQDHTKWDPFRLSDEDRDWGDWIRRYDMAFSLGNPGITFITKDPFDQAVDDQQNPVAMLYRAINQAVKAGTGHPSWNPLIFGATGRSAPLSLPKDGYVMQGILMEHKSNPQTPPRGCLMEHQPVVFLMSQSAGAALLDRLSEKTAEGAWRWPDITALDAGMFVQFAQVGTPLGGAITGPPQQMGQNMTVGGGSGNAADNNRYDVQLLDLYNGISPTFQGIHQLAEAHVRPWDSIIRVPTIEEQVKLICSAGIPASAIVYALGDVYRDFIPQHIWDQARAQQSHNLTPYPGANPMGGGNPMGGVNPMQATGGNPMGAPVAASQPYGGQAQGMQTVGQTATAPAGTPVDQTKQVPQPQAETATQGFDPPPTHADPERAKATMDAVARARARAAAQAGG